jgi:hypothetical protein
MKIANAVPQGLEQGNPRGASELTGSPGDSGGYLRAKIVTEGNSPRDLHRRLGLRDRHVVPRPESALDELRDLFATPRGL